METTVALSSTCSESVLPVILHQYTVKNQVCCSGGYLFQDIRHPVAIFNQAAV